MDVRFTIARDGQLYVYDSDHIESVTIRRDERITATEREVGDAQLGIHDKLLGVRDLFVLGLAPTDTLRALIEVEGIVALDGTLAGSDIEHTPQMKRWVCTVTQNAIRAFERRLDGVRLRERATEILPLLSEHRLLVDRQTDTGLERSWDFWFSLAELWTAVAEVAGYIEVVDVAPRDIEVAYLDSSSEAQTWTSSGDVWVAQYVEDSSVGTEPVPGDNLLPDWTALDCFRICQQLYGWRLHCAFAPFPSPVIVATLTPDTYARPVVPELSGLETEFPTLKLVPPERQDFGVVYAQPATAESLRIGALSPPVGVVYAADVSRLDAEGRAQNADLISVPLVVPNLVDIQRYDLISGDYSETVEAGIVLRQQEDSASVFVTGVYNPSGVELAVRQRQPARPLGASTYAAHAAGTVASRYQLSRAGAAEITGAWDVEGLSFEVGRLDLGLSWQGRSGVVTERRQDAETGIAELTLRVPLDLAPAVPVTPQVGPPRNFAAAVTQRDGNGRLLVGLSWDAPAQGSGLTQPDQYRIEARALDADEPFTLVAETAATSFDFAHAVLSAGEYRVRSETNAGPVSSWVYQAAFLPE